MSTNIEIEAKVLLSKKSFETVLEYMHAEKYKRVKQTNHYIDSDDAILRKLGFALRIREKEDFVLTLKTPMSEGLLEKSQAITWKQYERLSHDLVFPEGAIKDFLVILGINVNKLKILTSLTTERIEIPYKDGILSLDRNNYNGHTDYELELEHTSMHHAEECLLEICTSAKVDCVFNQKSKQARAMDTMKGQ